MALVLVATGFLLYTNLGKSLDGAIDDGLRAHATAVAALVQQGGHTLTDSRKAERDRGFAQVLDRQGRIFDQTPGLDREPLLESDQLVRAWKGPGFLGSDLDATSQALDGMDVRLFTTPIHARGQRLLVIVGASLDVRQDALTNLRRELLIGGPLALLVASLVGYGVAAAALRPVERMRRRAAALSASEPGQRLPVPPQRDEIGRLGTTLNEMLERLEAARERLELGLERERSFVADASHELRTPLALLKTEIELALDEPHSAAELREALRSAGEETERLTQLSEGLLLLARVEKDKLATHPGPLELDDLLRGVARNVERRAAHAGRRIEVRRTRGTVIADRVLLEQALGNLVENSLRYGAGTIELDAREVGAGVELHVTDEGEGFPASFLPRAFERFSRADEARGRGGTGLGLAIVAAVAVAHGGDAHAANLPGGGSDVWLFLPQPPPEPTSETAELSFISPSSAEV